jgi:hypothetical protein
MPQWIPEKKLEPEAVEGIARTGATADSVVGESVIALSRAISARRSADALEQIALSDRRSGQCPMTGPTNISPAISCRGAASRIGKRQ